LLLRPAAASEEQQGEYSADGEATHARRVALQRGGAELVNICRQQSRTTERLTTLGRQMTLKRHKHTAVTIHAIRQRAGVPYHVERKICSDCRRLLDEKTIRRAAA